MTPQEQIDRLIENLENVQAVPRMFFGDNVPPVVNFIWGFNLACNAFGVIDEYNKIYNEVRVEHGWSGGSRHPFEEMNERGFSNEEAIREIINMEIETWRRVSEKMGSEV